jgi:hypothetical protein
LYRTDLNRERIAADEAAIGSLLFSDNVFAFMVASLHERTIQPSGSSDVARAGPEALSLSMARELTKVRGRNPEPLTFSKPAKAILPSSYLPSPPV